MIALYNLISKIKSHSETTDKKFKYSLFDIAVVVYNENYDTVKEQLSNTYSVFVWFMMLFI